MRDSIKQAIGETVQDMLDAGLKTSLTKKELNTLGINMPVVELSADQIKVIRQKMALSQTVFAQVLNVSASSVRKWEQGKRQPTGSTKVLLELLEKSPTLLDHRLGA